MAAFPRDICGMFTSMPQIYKFPQSSLAELARNSVRQSGFEMEIKRHWLGGEWYLPGAAGNDINKVKYLPSCTNKSSLRSMVDKCS